MKNLRRSGVFLFLAAILILSTGAFAPLSTDIAAPDRAVDGTPALQVLWVCIDCIVAVLLAPKWKSGWRVLTANPLIVLLVAACALSGLWSENPSVTFRKSVALLGTTLIGMLFALDFNFKEQVAVVSAALGAVAIASLIVSLVCPERFPATESAPLAWNGVFSHKNLLGRAMSLGALGFVSLDRRSLRIFLLSWGGGALCFAMLLASHSQTALIVLLAMCIAIALSHLLRCHWRIATGAEALLIAACVPIVWLALAHAETLFATLHRDVTFTGRARIWSFAALSLFRQPILGYGYGAFWWVASESRQTLAFIGYPTPHAHNGFIDLGLQLGFVGIALFLAGWLVALKRAVADFRTTAAHRWPLIYLLFLVSYSLTENSLLSPNSLLWILYVAICCRVSLDAAGRHATATATAQEALPV